MHTERKAIAQKHIRTLKGQVKIADDNFQKSKECKAILNKKKPRLSITLVIQVREINTSIEQDIDDLNKAKGWGEHIKVSRRTKLL
jgi:hypothetical protein